MIILTVFGSLGGIVAFGSAIYVVLRGAFAQAQAIKDNTEAINNLTKAFTDLDNDMTRTRLDVEYLKGQNR